MAGTVVVVGACVTVALATGVQVGELARSFAYDALFVLVPGVLAMRALTPDASALRLAALGWILGILMAATAFVVCVKAGAGPAFFGYPFIAVACSLLALHRTRSARCNTTGDSAEHCVPGSRWAIWSLVAVVVGALLIAWPLRIHEEPLPRDVTSAIAYDRDTLYYLGLAADAEREGVPGYPGVSGSPLDFPDLAFIDAGARAFATGIDPSVVLLRLQRLSLVIAAALAFALAGAALGGRVATAPVAAALALLAGELDINRDPAYTSLFAFPPYLVTEEQIDLLLGSAVFVAALVLIWEMLRASEAGAVPRRVWLLSLAFVLGSAEAKGAAAPVLFGGAVCLVAWALVATRTLLPGALRVLALTTAGLVWLYAVVVRGSSYGVTVKPLALFEDLALFQQMLNSLPHGAARAVAWVAGVPAWMIGLFGGLLCGVPWAFGLLADPGRRRLLAWPLACLLAGAGPLLLFDHVGTGQRDFAWFGVYAAIPVSATGLVLLVAWRTRVVAMGALVVGATLLVASAAQPGATQPQRYAWSMAAALMLPVVAGAVVLVGKWTRPHWQVAAAVTTAGLLAAAVLDRPIDVWSRLPVLHERGSPPATEIRVDRDLVRGYMWIAEHSSRDAILALAPIATGEPNRYFLLTALAQRPVFLEGWGNSRRASDLGFARVFSGEVQPFPERDALNRRAFAGDVAALRELRDRYGVQFLVVDRLNSEPVRTRVLGPPLFENKSVAVFAVDPLRSRNSPRSG